MDFLFDSLDSLLEPQCEVGGVADHAEQVRRVLLFVLSGPDAADQLGWPDSSVEERGFYFSDGQYETQRKQQTRVK